MVTPAPVAPDMLPEDPVPTEPDPEQNAPADEAAGAEAGDTTPASEGEQPAAPAGPPDKKNWYIVKVQSGREDSIKEAIERRVKIEGLEEYFGQIIIPVEKVTELRNGKRVVRTRKMYPGYIVANVEFNDRILYLFRETPGVGDFVGASATNRNPPPLSTRERDKLLLTQLPRGEGKDQIEKIKIPFDKGDRVRVRDGTFSGMEGEVKEIMEPKDPKEPPRVRVELTIFGRPVPVEVEVWQVEPVD